MRLFSLFCRAAFVTCIQGAGVVAFAGRHWWAVITAGIIQLVWASNVRDVVDYRNPGVRIAFTMGGMFGAAVVLWFAR